MEHYNHAKLMDAQRIIDAVPMAYQNAVVHGFHNQDLPFRHWLMMIVTEISEVIEADRRERHADFDSFKREIETYDVVFERDGHNRAFKDYFDKYIKDSVEDEFADICIRTFDLIGLLYKKQKFDQDEFIYEIQLEPLNHDWKLNTEWAWYAIECFEWLDTTSRPRVVSYTIGSFLHLIDLWASHAGIDDLWTYIDLKMRYNTIRPIGNGKTY